MKKITVEIKFDDEDGYTGHGDSVPELIIGGLKNFMEIDLEHDKVIKEGWDVKIVEEKTINEEPTTESMDAVGNCLKVASEHNLQVEVITFALKAMKENPNLNVSDAINDGLNEWVK